MKYFSQAIEKSGCIEVSKEMFSSQFNSWLLNSVILMNEFSENKESRKASSAAIKLLTSSSATINEKGIRPYKIDNVAYIAFACNRIISSVIGYNIKLSLNGTRTLVPVFQDVNNYCYWTDGYYYLYSEPKFGWMLINGKFPGYTPLEYHYRNDKGEFVYAGDNFYTGSLPSESGSSTFRVRGALRNNQRK